MSLHYYHPRNYAAMSDAQISQWFELIWKLVTTGEAGLQRDKRIVEVKAMKTECRTRPALSWIVRCCDKGGY